MLVKKKPAQTEIWLKLNQQWIFKRPGCHHLEFRVSALNSTCERPQWRVCLPAKWRLEFTTQGAVTAVTVTGCVRKRIKVKISLQQYMDQPILGPSFRCWSLKLTKKPYRRCVNDPQQKIWKQKRNYFLTQDVIRLWNLVTQVIREATNRTGFQRARTLKEISRLQITENKNMEQLLFQISFQIVSTNLWCHTRSLHISSVLTIPQVSFLMESPKVPFV